MEEHTQAALSGTVETVNFRNEQNGFTVLELNDGEELVTVVGVLQDAQPGDTLRLTGEWTLHPSFGQQFKVESCVRDLPATQGDMLRYLSSGAIKGIGPATAEKIIDAFGEQAFEVLENSPERLAGIQGISLRKAKEMCRAFGEQFSAREAMLRLGQLGLTPAESVRAFRSFGAAIADRIAENPYVLCSDTIGVSFERADEIAYSMQASPDEMLRVMAGIVYIMRHNLGNGHTCIPRDKLVLPAQQMLDADADTVEIAIDNLISNEDLNSDLLAGREFLFLPHIYEAEKSIASRIRMMAQFPPQGEPAMEERIETMERSLGLTYAKEQKQAIRAAIEKGLLILTGGPGTGKTTALNGIIYLMQKQNLDLALAAPTGRAAKRMTEITGVEAKTIHRLLEVEWDSHDKPVFSRNMKNPLEIDALIVDEASMIDVTVFSALLDALPLGCMLILVGDFDQLPPVGAGNILQDLIQSGLVEVVKLTEVFRQALESRIVVNAHQIVRGEMPDITDKSSDFFFLQERSSHEAAQTIAELVSVRLPNAYGYDPKEQIQVLCPSRKGELGTVNLNRILQQRLNPQNGSKAELQYNGYTLREGDKVMQIKNNYDIIWMKTADGEEGTGIFNGDIGTVLSIERGYDSVKIQFDDKVAFYALEQCKEIELAYAITVHKSQGSEFHAVVMPMRDIPPLLSYRNLLYTAVTRAKELLIAVGSPETMQAMIDNNKKAKRFSALNYFLEL